MHYWSVGWGNKEDFAMVMGNGGGILLRRTHEEESFNLMNDGAP